jgi:hypothetical protein
MALTKITGEGVGAVDNLTVDTNTLVVDAANNSVGIGTTSLITASGRSSLTLSTANEKGELHLQNRTATTSSDTGVLTFNNGSNRIGAIQSTADGATDKGKLIFMSLSGGSVAGRMDLTEHGLTFNGDTAAANALSDYEEGTFTPQLLGGTSNPSSTVSGSGEYIKVGKLVFIYIKFHNVNTTGASGYIRITGQPFNPSQTNGPLSMSSYDFDFSGRTSLTAEINNGEINGVTSGDDTGWGLLNFGAGTSRYIFIAGTYRVA